MRKMPQTADDSIVGLFSILNTQVVGYCIFILYFYCQLITGRYEGSDSKKNFLNKILVKDIQTKVETN